MFSGVNDVTPPFLICITLPCIGTAIDRQFGWGGTPAKKYHRYPMVDSSSLEL